jgi:hypothetical protein
MGSLIISTVTWLHFQTEYAHGKWFSLAGLIYKTLYKTQTIRMAIQDMHGREIKRQNFCSFNRQGGDILFQPYAVSLKLMLVKIQRH